MVTLQLRQLHVPPGQRLLIEDVTWADFEAIVEELGEHRGTRVAYSQGVLEIVSPFPAHEKATVIISDLVKILLDELDMPWESLGSPTFRRAEMAAGIEPDDCFYIQHHAAMVGKERLDLGVDPHRIWFLKWISRHRPPCRLMPRCKSRKSGAITIEHYRSLYGMTVATSTHHTVPRFLRYP